MLTELRIRNIAVAEHLELTLTGGLTVLTGETGAGKSIIVDALLLALGGRASADLVRTGSEQAEVAARFSLEQLPIVAQWLRDNDLDDGDECLIRRIIPRSGNSRSYINGHPASAKQLKELGGYLVELQGQHEYHALLQTEAQGRLLDRFAGHDPLLSRLAGEFRAWQTAHNDYQDLEQELRRSGGDLEMLRIQESELEALGLDEGEWETLEAEHRKLGNLRELVHSSDELLQLLEDREEGSILGWLHQAENVLFRLLSLDATPAAASELLENGTINLREVAAEIRQYRTGLEVDPEQAAAIEQRLTSAFHLGRKYQVRPEQLPSLLVETREKLARLSKGEEALAGLRAEIDHCFNRYRETAEQVGASRREAARRLSGEVRKRLAELGMEKADFSVQVEALPRERPAANGWEKIQFLISTNPGQALAPLAKIASGGELSRVNLAIRVATVEKEKPPTIVFDEVDSGIGGAIAEVVGNQLQALARHGQVLTITHLPQVAVKGQSHLVVSKQQEADHTNASVAFLSADGRIEEIARMLGGMTITVQTRKHAAELLSANRS